MPFKITNITEKTLKKALPLNIEFKDPNTGDSIRNTIQPNQFIILYFKPISVRQLEIRNVVTVEFITQNDITALTSPVSKVNTTPAEPSKNNLDEKEEKDFIENNVSDPEGLNKDTKKRGKKNNNDSNEVENDG